MGGSVVFLVSAVALGIIAGVLGALPLFGAIAAVKRVTETSSLSHASILLLAVVASTAILAGAVLACAYLDRQDILAFAVAEAVGLVASVAVFGVRKLSRK